MRLRFVLPCLLIASIPAFGQSSSESEACLRNVAEVLQPQARLTADFRMQKFVPGVTRPLPGKGRVVSDPVDGLIWETTFPLQHVRVFGKKHYAVTDEKGELRVHEHQAADFMSDLTSRSSEELIMLLNRSFFVSCSKKDNAYSLILSPKNGTLANYLTEFTLAAQDGKVTHATITQTDGTTTRLQFDNVKLPAEAAARDDAFFARVR